MENKKQLVIVPPLSEPLQKLNEVLQGIAVDENIEISIVDDTRELNQFMGSAGQSLVVFSNAKKCAMFLQENRFVLAKTHSKVILLTPKEIPTKTLVKFVKIGLTESILESSPPKTLLYKVKLLLRSIKSTSVQQEDKDQVVKSMLDATQDSTQKDEAVSESEQATAEPTLNYLKEDKKKKKNENNENAVDYGENLKGKNNYQEDSIDTNWKSARKKDSSLNESAESEDNKIEADDSSIDMYYRGKKKTATSLFNEEESNLKTKSSSPEEDQGEGFTKTKKSLETQLDLDPAEKKKSTYTEAEDGIMSVKKEKRLELDIEESEAPTKEKHLSAEEKEIAKKKDYDELEALFEAAKKRQAMEAEDLGGHLKGKISNLENDEDDDSEIEERKEYDNSDLYKKEKQLDLDLIEAEAAATKKRQLEDPDDEKDPHTGEVDHISTYMSSENNSTDKIETNMMSEMSEDKSKKISTRDTFDLDPKNKNEEVEVDDDETNSRKKKQLLDDESELSEKKKSIYEKDEESGRKKQTHLDIEASIVDRTKNENQNDESDDLDDDKNAGIKLQLIDGDLQNKKASLEEIDPHMSFKKLDQELVESDDNGRKSGGGKVDKIDTFYRSGEAKKKEHSWDNLAGRRDQTQSAEEKKAAREDGTTEAYGKKDLGETTIDYRAMKAEFDYIAKNGRSEDGPLDGSPEGSRNLNQSEDSGTFKVIEIDARGFEFSIDMLNLIYQKDSKPQDFYKKVSEELISYYHAYPVFYTYKVSDKSHIEAFDSFMHFGDSLVPQEHKEWWINLKSQTEFKPRFEDYFSKSMTTWLCRDIPDKSGNGSYWQDVELPSWAEMELKDKKVEMIFPYYDGVDRMGMAVIFFPEGVNPSAEKSIMVTLEMVRTVQLESIQRALAPEASRSENGDAAAEPEQKNKITSMFKGFFNRNKAS